MASRIVTLTIDCADPKRVADFWCVALGFELKDIDEYGVEIADPAGAAPPLLFIVVPEGKSAKNRLHLDLRPPRSMAEEVERLKVAGATQQRHVEEGGSFWTVMLDPEGNEFCVLRGPKDREGADE